MDSAWSLFREIAKHSSKKFSSSFFVRGLEWPIDAQVIDGMSVQQIKTTTFDVLPTSKLILHFSSFYKLKLAVSLLRRFAQY